MICPVRLSERDKLHEEHGETLKLALNIPDAVLLTQPRGCTATPSQKEPHHSQHPGTQPSPFGNPQENKKTSPSWPMAGIHQGRQLEAVPVEKEMQKYVKRT